MAKKPIVKKVEKVKQAERTFNSCNNKLMTLSELKKDMDCVTVEIIIDFVGKRNRSLAYGEDKFIPVIVKDSTGEMNLTFFGDACDEIAQGMKLRLTNLYVNEYKGNLQLNTSRKTELIVLERPKKKPSFATYFARTSRPKSTETPKNDLKESAKELTK